MKLIKIFKHVFFPKQKFSLLFPQRSIENAGHYSHVNVILNNKTILQQKAKYFKAPTDLYQALRYIKVETPYIFISRNQKGFNTFMFHRAYDVVITDRSGRVIELERKYDNNKISKHFPTGYYVYFMPTNTISYYEIGLNDLLLIKKRKFR